MSASDQTVFLKISDQKIMQIFVSDLICFSLFVTDNNTAEEFSYQAVCP